MHRLNAGPVSLDASVVVDFHLTNNIALLEELFVGRMMISDFVEDELEKGNIHLPGAIVAPLTTAEEWQFFSDLRRDRRVLGVGELGALTVARFHNAALLTNDKQARDAAEELGIAVHGSIGILEYAAGGEKISGREAVKVLEEMILAGAWISDELVELFRQRVLERE